MKKINYNNTALSDQKMSDDSFVAQNIVDHGNFN